MNIIIPDIKEILINNYNFLESVEELIPIDVKPWNIKYKVIEKQNYYFVKAINKYSNGYIRSLSDLKFHLEFIIFLTYNGSIKPVLPKKNNQEKFITENQNYYILLFPWIDISDFDISKSGIMSSLRESACLLADLHNASVKFPRKLMRRDLPHCYSPSVWADKIENIWKVEEMNLVKNNCRKNNLILFRKFLKVSKDFINRNGNLFSHNTELYTVIHGDFKPENIIISSSEKSIVDFDMAQNNYLETELTYAALTHSGERWLYSKRNWELYTFYIKEYEECSSRTIDLKFIKLVTEWNILKWISLVYKEEQLINRIILFDDFVKNKRNL